LFQFTWQSVKLIKIWFAQMIDLPSVLTEKVLTAGRRPPVNSFSSMLERRDLLQFSMIVDPCWLLFCLWLCTWSIDLFYMTHTDTLVLLRFVKMTNGSSFLRTSRNLIFPVLDQWEEDQWWVWVGVKLWAEKVSTRGDIYQTSMQRVWPDVDDISLLSERSIHWGARGKIHVYEGSISDFIFLASVYKGGWPPLSFPQPRRLSFPLNCVLR